MLWSLGLEQGQFLAYLSSLLISFKRSSSLVSSCSQDYLYNLATAIRELEAEIDDAYLFELEAAVRALDALEIPASKASSSIEDS